MVPGTNIVINETVDSTVVWLDLDEPDPSKRYQMSAVRPPRDDCYTILQSANGIDWRVSNPCTAGKLADRSSVFKNPMRTPSKWVYSCASILHSLPRVCSCASQLRWRQD